MEQIPRINAIQAAEGKLFGHRISSATDGDTKMHSEDSVVEGSNRPSTRRRSEQPESADDAPRRRMRCGSMPNEPSPVISSPLVASPNLSIASSVTQRPRTAGSRRVASTNASLRTSRPKSSDGFSNSSASLRSTPSIPSFGSTAPRSIHSSSPGLHNDSPGMLNPFAFSPSPHSSPLLQAPGAETAGLFANFAGFTLKPPAEGLGHKAASKQIDVPPKPGVARTKQREKQQADDAISSYQPPVLLSRSEPALISGPLTTTSSRSSYTDSSSRSSPPAALPPYTQHPASTHLGRSPSKTPSVSDPLSSNGQSLLGRRKSSMPLGFSFFRRSSKA